MTSLTDSSNNKLAKLAHIFHLMGSNSQENIRIILEQTCSILGAVCSFYNRIDDIEKSLEVWSGYQHSEHGSNSDAPIDISARMTICKETTIKSKGKAVVLSNLSDTIYLKAESVIKKYDLNSYLGFPVSLEKEVIGSLCVLDSRKRDFTHDEIHTIQILAEALSLEEEKLTLESKLKDLKQMELVSTITGGAAHSLNNILSGLVSYPELLLMQLPKESPLKDSISFMHEAGIKAADIVQDLLCLTRRGGSNQTIINLNNAIFEYFNSSEQKRIEKNFPSAGFQVKTDPALFDISGSPTHILKILQNLLMNAAKSLQPNGRIMVKTFNQKISSRIPGPYPVPSGEYACLEISDDGASLSPDDLKTVFEPFNTRKNTTVGSGFGLCVVYNSVKDHNGYLQVESKTNKGNTFKIYFPATH